MSEYVITITEGWTKRAKKRTTLKNYPSGKIRTFKTKKAAEDQLKYYKGRNAKIKKLI